MNSWDCFDTLIGRSFMTPRSIFDIVSYKIQDPSFTTKRINAEKFSKYKTYEDIYSLLPQYDPAIELEVEKQYSFPILENWNLVKDGDIIISDMYLSKQQILSILEYHGFNKDVEIIVSYSGKHNGNSWKILNNNFSNVQQHCGDNIKSDVINARKFGLNAIFYSGSSFTPDEISISHYSHELASLMRRVRLSNPFRRQWSKYIHNNGSLQNIAGHIWREEINGYHQNYFKMYQHNTDHIILKRLSNPVFVKINFDGISFYSENGIDYSVLYKGYWMDEDHNNDDCQKLLWSDQSQYNIPLLVTVALSLPRDKNIVFSQRDCFYLYKIYQNLIDNPQCSMLDVSRRAYYHPFNKEYIEYVINSTQNALVVDSHGSGSSATHFFKQHNISLDLYHIFKHPSPSQHTDVKYDKLCNRSFNCFGRFFEKHNVQYSGALIGWKNNQPQRLASEHNKIICDTILRCINDTTTYLYLYKNTILLKDSYSSLINDWAYKLKNTFTEQLVDSIGK